MNFLELCRQVEIESGTVDVSKLMTTVANPTSRRLKVIGWVQEAWTMIQTSRLDWRFLRREYGAILEVGNGRYTGKDLSISRFAAWYRDQPCYQPHSLYDRTIGATDTTELREISWTAWRERHRRGLEGPGRPQVYAISPEEKLCLGPVPDKAYQIEGEYYRAPQLLNADGDIPEVPVNHHLAIVWRALMLLGDHDEAGTTIARSTAKYFEAIEKLQRDQVDRPRIGCAAPIA